MFKVDVFSKRHSVIHSVTGVTFLPFLSICQESSFAQNILKIYIYIIHIWNINMYFVISQTFFLFPVCQSFCLYICLSECYFFKFFFIFLYSLFACLYYYLLFRFNEQFVVASFVLSSFVFFSSLWKPKTPQN